MSEFSKRTKTKKVEFKKDFFGIYAKGSTHYIHEDTVKAQNLKAYGTVSDVDFKALHKAAAKASRGKKD